MIHINRFFMSLKQLTPTEALQLKKKQLEVRSEALSKELESKFDYLRKNAIPLLSDSVMDSIVSKMPPFVRNFICRQDEGASKEIGISPILSGVASGIIDLAPLLLKGKKGFMISFLLQQAKNLFFSRK
jgi:hypothetical protein